MYSGRHLSVSKKSLLINHVFPLTLCNLVSPKGCHHPLSTQAIQFSCHLCRRSGKAIPLVGHGWGQNSSSLPSFNTASTHQTTLHAYHLCCPSGQHSAISAALVLFFGGCSQMFTKLWSLWEINVVSTVVCRISLAFMIQSEHKTVCNLSFLAPQFWVSIQISDY